MAELQQTEQRESGVLQAMEQERHGKEQTVSSTGHDSCELHHLCFTAACSQKELHAQGVWRGKTFSAQGRFLFTLKLKNHLL